MIANLRIDGDPVAVMIVTEALRTLLGDTAHLGTPHKSTYGKYAGTSLVRGTVNATAVAARAAMISELRAQANQGDSTL